MYNKLELSLFYALSITVTAFDIFALTWFVCDLQQCSWSITAARNVFSESQSSVSECDNLSLYLSLATTY